MWIPENADDLNRAITDGSLPHESARYEYKTALPEAKKTRDIAVDVAAMSTTGGIVIYGVKENKQAATFEAAPIEFAGVKDRISDVVSSNIQERVDFDVRLLPLPEDAGRGFVVVDVPASARAPHMVEVKGEHRYYGRSPGGNQLLTESRIAQLYERRERIERDGMAFLDGAVADPPIEPSADRGDLFVVARPLTSDDELRARSWPKADDITWLAGTVQSAQASVKFARPMGPGFAEMVIHSQLHQTISGIVLENPIFRGSDGEWIDRHVARLEIDDDGTVRYFRAALANGNSTTGAKQIHEVAMAQITAHVLAFCGQLYDAGGYHGAVICGLALVGAEDAVSSEWLSGQYIPPIGQYPTVTTSDYRKAVRLPARQLVTDPAGVARQLVGRLLRTIRHSGFADPLAPADTAPGE